MNMLAPSIFGRNFVDSMFDDFFDTPLWNSHPVSARPTMSTDITESDSGYQIEMDLPGFTKEDVNASLHDGYLTIAASQDNHKEEKASDGKLIRKERYMGTCQRSFYVGDHITEEDIKANFKDGVLTILVPKKEKKPEVEEKKFIAIEG